MPSLEAPLTDSIPDLREIPSRYRGGVLLVCAKCERKLRRSGKHGRAANLKKSLRKLGKGSDVTPIHVMAVPCMKLCPKDAVTVCTQAGLRQTPPTLTLIRTGQEIASLFRLYTAGPALPDTAASPSPDTAAIAI